MLKMAKKEKENVGGKETVNGSLGSYVSGDHTSLEAARSKCE